MSQLIQMRQRIKAVQTIQKVTQAMRIISMSTHTRLKKKVGLLDDYKKEIVDLFSHIKKFFPKWTNPFLSTEKNNLENPLVIVVASQKGLSGTFNSNLFRYCSKNLPQKKCDVIAIGKKAVEFIKTKKFPIITQHDSLSSPVIPSITQEIFDLIINANPQYTSTTIYSNLSRSFFLQKPQHTCIIPLKDEHTNNNDEKSKLDSDEYIWEQSHNEVLEYLAQTYIKIIISEFLFQSLLAEQAARFISMNSATQNAENMLEDMTLMYNKIRQAKITRELTDLSGSFQSD